MGYRKVNTDQKRDLICFLQLCFIFNNSTPESHNSAKFHFYTQNRQITDTKETQNATF